VYGDVNVELLDTAEYTDYVVRTFTISVVSRKHLHHSAVGSIDITLLTNLECLELPYALRLLQCCPVCV